MIPPRFISQVLEKERQVEARRTAWNERQAGAAARFTPARLKQLAERVRRMLILHQPIPSAACKC